MNRSVVAFAVLILSSGLAQAAEPQVASSPKVEAELSAYAHDINAVRPPASLQSAMAHASPAQKREYEDIQVQKQGRHVRDFNQQSLQTSSSTPGGRSLTNGGYFGVAAQR